MSLEFYTAATRPIEDLEDMLTELRNDTLFSRKPATEWQAQLALKACSALDEAIFALKSIPEE